MYFQKRGDKYYFLRYDETLKTTTRLKCSDTPVITNDEEAQKFCRDYEVKRNTSRVKIEKKLLWQELRPDFADILEKHERARKEDAPNSNRLDRTYLSYYVFPFFIELKKENDFNRWDLHMEDFRDYLLDVKSIRNKRNCSELAYATKNGIIKSLNAFMRTLKRRHLTDSLVKCRYFRNDLLNRKDETSVIPLDIQEAIQLSLRSKSSLAADFFTVSANSGLRMNELLGLSLADFRKGLPTSETIQDLLKKAHFHTFGHIRIYSQPKLASIRLLDGNVPRKPLKNRKYMEKKDGRIIPIVDFKAFNILVKRFNEQRQFYLAGTYGTDLRNYLLFDGLNKNIYSALLRHSQEKIKLPKPFTPHDLRHTFSTLLVEKTGGNFALCQMILGHSKMETTLRYVHINDRIHESVEISNQMDEPMEYAVAEDPHHSYGTLIQMEERRK